MKVSFLIFAGIVGTTSLLGQEKAKTLHFGQTSVIQLNVSQIGFKEIVDNTNPFALQLSGNVFFSLTQNLQLKTGIDLQIVRLSHRDYSPDYPGDFMNGELDRYKSYFEFESRYTFIGIPLELKIDASKKPNHFFLIGGLIGRTHLYSSGYISLIESGQLTARISPEDEFLKIKPSQLFISVGPGYEFRSKKRRILSLSLVYESSVSKMFERTSDALANGHFAFIGLRLGTVYLGKRDL
jgi:hypothetical protein